MNFDLNKTLSSLQGTMSELNSSLQPFAMRTKQMINERLGGSDEVTALPEEYVELEKRVDALKAFHTQVLAVLQTFEQENYDYPPNMKEQMFDFGRTVQERVHEVASVHSANELGSVLVGGGAGRKPERHEPRTLSHALARALGQAQLPLETAKLDILAKASVSLGQAESDTGAARLVQDASIQHVNAAYNTTLSTSLQFAGKARKAVHNARLGLDAAKATLKGKQGVSAQLAQAEVEKAEDEFVAAIEDAVTVMRNVLDTPEPVRGLAQYAHARLTYFKAAVSAFESALPDLDKFQEEQEIAYRESRQ